MERRRQDMKEQELLIRQRMKENWQEAAGAAGLEQQDLWMQGEEEELLNEWRATDHNGASQEAGRRWGRDGVILGAGDMLEGAGWWRRQRARTENDKAGRQRKKDDNNGLELKVGIV